MEKIGRKDPIWLGFTPEFLAVSDGRKRIRMARRHVYKLVDRLRVEWRCSIPGLEHPIKGLTRIKVGHDAQELAYDVIDRLMDTGRGYEEALRFVFAGFLCWLEEAPGEEAAAGKFAKVYELAREPLFWGALEWYGGDWRAMLDDARRGAELRIKERKNA